METRVADVIMACAPVQIKKGDDMPNFICQLCCTQLEKIHQFQTQIMQSEKTLRHYLQQLHASGKQIKTECSEDPLIHETISTGCAEDTVGNFSKNDGCENIKNNIRDSNVIDVNWKEKELAYFNSEQKIKEETTLNYGIKVEPIDAYPQISTECADDAIETLSKGCGTELGCGNSEIDVEHTWENFEGRCSADVTEDGDKLEGENKKVSKIEYKCEICNKCFSYSSSFYRHRRLHTGEKPYQCDVCNKQFSLSQYLKFHKRTHTDEKPYQCEVCYRGFVQSKNLIIHERTHIDKGLNQCDVCNKCFSRSSTLNLHKRIHTGEKLNRCDVCNKCFVLSKDLKVHKRTHTGEKPYQCDVCDKRFSQSQHLKTHKRTHTSEKP